MAEQETGDNTVELVNRIVDAGVRLRKAIEPSLEGAENAIRAAGETKTENKAKIVFANTPGIS